ncbi:hypothetical protein [Caballeronia sp. GaOx3]|uniref:hypothetical protein n=1 Tax=Caballeronia sp. GaOx3 TaxID=2921740 RepID=UPI0020278991|nr:hypothetical protein [Caballeronia sp. GaOx3]
MDVQTLSAALSSARTAFELVRSAAALRDDAKITAALEDLQNRIIDVQNTALQVQEKISSLLDEKQALKDGKRELSARIAELEKQRSERESYDLHELSEGVFVLAELNSSKTGRSPHYLCQPCMDNAAKKGVLKRAQVAYEYVLVCPICKNDYPTGEYVKIAI